MAYPPPPQLSTWFMNDPYSFHLYRPEALSFLILYAIYCIAMAYNSHFEAWAKDKLPVPDSWRQAQDQQAQLREEGTNYKTIHKVCTIDRISSCRTIWLRFKKYSRSFQVTYSSPFSCSIFSSILNIRNSYIL